ncbi:hypothetical protein UCRNP2_6315 [Neofusicoccum parvum UCRNP2]|uniref:Uncharacterized protein n=1 Tax=Botryosphaeria parva (strain UCR-NP2) TaxID=1287680 RepID=R1EGQ0_BOTPV|nr:hypothetical protein UCRNP2_6315 [Neofusicoccum parvum UCRNP2]
MGCSYVVHAGAKMLASFAGFAISDKNRRRELVREIKTLTHPGPAFVNIIWPKGKIAFHFYVKEVLDGATAAALDAGNNGGKYGGKPKRYARFCCDIQWARRGGGGLFGGAAAVPIVGEGDGGMTVTLWRAEMSAEVRHAWEPYRRTPRWDVQNALLTQLRSQVEGAMVRRYGPDYRSKVLKKAQGQDLALDEKGAYATMHSMGGPDGGGEWVHVPQGIQAPIGMRYYGAPYELLSRMEIERNVYRPGGRIDDESLGSDGERLDRRHLQLGGPEDTWEDPHEEPGIRRDTTRPRPGPSARHRAGPYHERDVDQHIPYAASRADPTQKRHKRTQHRKGNGTPESFNTGKSSTSPVPENHALDEPQNGGNEGEWPSPDHEGKSA